LRRWVTAGQDPSAFWQITPREVTVILEGADARDRTQMRISQAMAWATADLVRVAFHLPAKFPKFDKAFPDPTASREAQSPEDIWAAMVVWAESARLAEEAAGKEAP
jgi:predicted oxidoreductase (fatty acid repression mutant protein)